MNALGNRTTVVYDAVSQTRTLIDPNAGRNTFLYDKAGRRTVLIDPLSRRTTSGYDAAGRQILRIDARGNRTTYTFDGTDRLLGRKYPDGTRATFAYDAVENRITMHDATGRYTYLYDAEDHEAAVTLPSTQRLTYTYDAVSQRKSLSGPTSGCFTYTFDAAQLITRILNPEGVRASHSYDNAGRRVGKALGNGTRASFLYDDNNALIRLVNIRADSTTLSSYAYRLDPVGNRTAVVETDGSRVTWLYDSTYQLVGDFRTGTSAYRNTFTFDSRGNRLVTNQGGTRTTTSYDAASQIRFSSASAGRTTYIFDPSGNQQVVWNPDGTRLTTTWDFENQPTRYNQPAIPAYPAVTFTYNADNRRIEKASPAGTVKFIWDEQNYLAETDSSNVVTTLYTNEPQTFGNLISARNGLSTIYGQFDGLGSTRQLTNAAGVTTDTLLFDSWGNQVSRTGATPMPLLWVGELGYYFDKETGVIEIRERRYGAAIGKWTSRDPLYSELLRAYTYVSNRPAIHTDPSGLAGPFLWFLLLLIVLIFLAAMVIILLLMAIILALKNQGARPRGGPAPAGVGWTNPGAVTIAVGGVSVTTTATVSGSHTACGGSLSCVVSTVAVSSTTLAPYWQSGIGSATGQVQASWSLSKDKKTWVVKITGAVSVVPGLVVGALTGASPMNIQISTSVSVPSSCDLVKDANAIMASIWTGAKSAFAQQVRAQVAQILSNPDYARIPVWLKGMLQAAVSQF